MLRLRCVSARLGAICSERTNSGAGVGEAVFVVQDDAAQLVGDGEIAAVDRRPIDHRREEAIRAIGLAPLEQVERARQGFCVLDDSIRSAVEQRVGARRRRVRAGRIDAPAVDQHGQPQVAAVAGERARDRASRLPGQHGGDRVEDRVNGDARRGNGDVWDLRCERDPRARAIVQRRALIDGVDALAQFLRRDRVGHALVAQHSRDGERHDDDPFAEVLHEQQRDHQHRQRLQREADPRAQALPPGRVTAARRRQRQASPGRPQQVRERGDLGLRAGSARSHRPAG